MILLGYNKHSFRFFFSNATFYFYIFCLCFFKMDFKILALFNKLFLIIFNNFHFNINLVFPLFLIHIISLITFLLINWRWLYLHEESMSFPPAIVPLLLGDNASNTIEYILFRRETKFLTYLYKLVCPRGNSMCSFWELPLRGTVIFLSFFSFCCLQSRPDIGCYNNYIGARSWKDTNDL